MAVLKQTSLPQILKQMPPEWQGTTFRNSNLLGREVFAERLLSLIKEKAASGGSITTDDLVSVGNAEDYLRVSSNVSSTLELLLAEERGMEITNVLSFASSTMPIIAVALVSSCPVRVFVGDEAPFGDKLDLVKVLAPNLVVESGVPKEAESGTITLALESVVGEECACLDGLVGPNVLYILNPEAIAAADVLVIRKRMSTPLTTPMAITRLEEACEVPVTSIAPPSAEGLAGFYAHLQELCGTAVDPSANPVVFSAGLPALASLYITLIQRGGANVLMCSTAYGGSSQLTDLLVKREVGMSKHTFDVQGDADIGASLTAALDGMAALGAGLAPTTVLVVEVPTNPDMKVPDFAEVTRMLRGYGETTGKQVVLVCDVTFAPNSKILGQLKDLDPALAALVFISMSKSVSRGVTTAGGIVANHTDAARSLLEGTRATATAFDTFARDDQLARLVDNHEGVEQRCLDAYAIAASAGNVLVEAVREACGADMALAFVSPANAAKGFTSSTFSFNLPPVADAQANEALAQRYVDLLTQHKEFKPCVSFGQDNGLVYATVPATSTQGAIKSEDKAKQAVGGVQLTRLSFPPTCDQGAVNTILREAVVKLYATV